LVIVALCRNLVHVLTSALDNCAARRLVAIVGGLGLDMELNVTGRPTILYCQPWPDQLPDPLACLLTGITPQRCQQVGLPELQFVEAVHRELAAPATIAFGYNSIAFDDEITRLMFWRNLMDPYARKWKDDCGRWDLLRLVRATHALHPETLEWPRDEQGEVSLRLERISAANGPAARIGARRIVRRGRHGRAGAAHPRAPAAALCALLLNAGQEPGAAGTRCRKKDAGEDGSQGRPDGFAGRFSLFESRT
jgi:hypothetical protein